VFCAVKERGTIKDECSNLFPDYTGWLTINELYGGGEILLEV